MIVLVSDTSILVDLERGGLLEAAFTCGLTMVVPDLLYQRELEGTNGAYLRTLGLNVVELTPDELSLAQKIRTQRLALSLPDCFALCCALRPEHALLTGDKALRKEAEARRVHAVHGLLWVLDQMAASERSQTTLLHEGLSRIAADPRCRLPPLEIQARLAKWSSS